MHQELYNSVDWEMTKILLTGQSPILAFDSKNNGQYFDFLTRKTHELDFKVSIRNIELCLNFKMAQESPQSNTIRSRCSQNANFAILFLLLYLIAFYLLNILHFIFSFNHFKPSSIIQISSQFMPFDDWILKPIKTWSFYY